MNRSEFRRRIRTSLENPTLQIALDFNAERRVNGRISALATLPNWKEKRQQAHAIRAEAIDHLDEYLEQFIRRATEHGIIVHRAQDAKAAIQIILEIIRSNTGRHLDGTGNESDRTALLVAKSKSMVTEEVNLNQALEAEGMRVVETDLGEYIVQLRGERPAHILTPAVHLRRADVGRLFHEKLGIPYTEDIPTLTDTARQLLRNVFLTADIGISGVNFGVAETGTICILSNEGNDRMVSTLPPVHIALMGMERMVRSLDELGVMLSLLARSATGQKLSVYTQLIQAPLPGQQRHLVLLDNGRSRLRHSPLKESLYCIRCGSCLNACPVFREIGGHAYQSPYSGPIGSVISAGLFGSDFVPLAQASSLCGACKEACPVDIDLPKLLSRVRAGQTPVTDSLPSVANQGGGLSTLGKFFLKIYSRVAPRPILFALLQKLAALGTRLISPVSDYVHLPAFTGWGYSKDLPRFATRTFRDRWNSLAEERVNPLPDQARSQDEIRQETGRSSQGSLIAQFEEELRKVNGNVIHTSPQEVTDKVVDLLKASGVTRIHLEPNTLDAITLEQAGITATVAPDPALQVGVTKAVCGLADTGSILITDGEGDPLQASLLPRVHLAVLCASDILPSLANALTLPAVRNSKSAVVITGPSRTADIEMSLTIGMHGPGEVHVFLVHATTETLVDD